MDSNGIILNSDYPYKAKSGEKCEAKEQPKELINIEVVNYCKSTEKELAKILDNGPVVVGISVGESLYKYSKGVLMNCGLTGKLENLNHAVVVVGYGVDAESNLPYWKIQNSWGSDWGEEGYFRILRDGNCRCGICLEPSQMKLRYENTVDEIHPHYHPDTMDDDYYEDKETEEETDSTLPVFKQPNA